MREDAKKNEYRSARGSLSREEASKDLFEGLISPERLERIENGKMPIHPDEVVLMAEKYKRPFLRNYYCSHECPIGKYDVPEVEMKDLEKIVLQMLASLNNMKNKQEKLIEITSDGQIDDDEIKDFIYIQSELERISVAVESLNLWAEQMLVNGKINMEKYKALKNGK